MSDTPFHPLLDQVQGAFSAQGPLAQADARYSPRWAQQRMALAVAQAIVDTRALVVEAGTGVGKTFAYLVPALLSGRKVLVSTATKSLQDQLHGRDLPRLLSALNLPVRQVVLKGRSSYLCPHRLALAPHSLGPGDGLLIRALNRVQAWAPHSLTGDLGEVPGLEEHSRVIPLVSSTRENCLGTECPQVGQCPLLRARREALAADVVIVNHHLFFADLALRGAGQGELLPAADIAIFDEAHQMPDVGLEFLGEHLASGALLDWSREALSLGLMHARGLAAWGALNAGLELATRDWVLALGSGRGGRGAEAPPGRRAWADLQAIEPFWTALARVQAQLQAWVAALEPVQGMAPDLARLTQRGQAFLAQAGRFLGPIPSDRVRWLDLSAAHVRLTESPLDIREALHAAVQAQPRTWVFTSATLGDDADLSWFTQATGLEAARCERVGSPFDYPHQARVWVPRELPSPKDEAHSQAVADLAWDLAERLGGRTFVLTTTLRALRSIGATLQAQAQRHGGHIQVWQQGQHPRRELLQRFLDTPQSVLVGSHSFWEGIDVAGSALQCVVIDKLPFPPPHDPLVQARCDRLQAQGRSPFDAYSLPETAVALQQGAGRLIRTEQDRGLLVLCDPRLRQMGYGRRLMAALPPMTPIHDRESALQWLDTVKASATGF